MKKKDANNQSKSEDEFKSKEQQSTQVKRSVVRIRRKSNLALINLSGKSLFILKHDHRIRVTLKNFIEHPYFEGFIYHIIGLNCLLLAMSEPVLSDPY